MYISQIQFNNFSLPKKVVNKINSNQSKNIDLKALYPQNYNNYISFGAKTNKEKLEYIGEENFPNETILNRYKEAIETGSDKRLYQIHSEYYADLITCETLEEAKELYPEFENIVDAKDIIDTHEKSLFNKIKQGKFEELTSDNLSLKLLQNHYGKMTGINAKEKNYGIDGHSLRNLFSKLNIIELNKKYMMTMHRETPEYAGNVSRASLLAWQNPEYRQGRSEDAQKRWRRDEYRQKQHDTRVETWKNPDVIAKASERMKKLHEDSDFEAKRRASVREYWENPETREQALAQITAAGRKRWDTPGSRERMSEMAREWWQNPEYRKTISEAISKTMKKQWQKPEYIEMKRQAMLEKWEDPDFREYVTAVNTENWKKPEYREKMQVYSDALKLAWEMHPDIREKMSEISKEFPGHAKLLTKAHSGATLTSEEERLLTAYYKRCHEEMPGFTWIVGQTQKQIIAEWKKKGIIPLED